MELTGLSTLGDACESMGIVYEGDDAAVSKIGDEYLVVSKDMLTEGIHFDLTYTPLKHLGYKSVVSNIGVQNSELRVSFSRTLFPIVSPVVLSTTIYHPLLGLTI